jgi:predicted nucleic acid-binding protein
MVKESVIPLRSIPIFIAMEKIMNKKIWRIYVDSTVVSGMFDYHMPERIERAKLFWNDVKNGKIRIVASEVLEQEIRNAPQHVRDFFADLPESQIERVVSTSESDDLADRYIAEGVVGESNLNDCRHVAAATLAEADVLVSWNFRHIVKLNKIYRYNAINKLLGYHEIEIRTPEEVNYDY